jgi:hypothetical protein
MSDSDSFAGVLKTTGNGLVTGNERLLATIRWWTLGVLVSIQALLAFLHIAITWAEPGTYPDPIVRLVHLDREGNLPTWFSTGQLILLGLSFFFISILVSGRRHGRWMVQIWLICGVGAFFLSADEAAGLHEALSFLLMKVFDGAPPDSCLYALGDFPSYYWLLVYGPVGVLVGVFLIRWFWRELGPARGMAILGLCLFFLGAVVLDYLEGRYGDLEHEPMALSLFGIAHRLDVFLVEEMMEMAGVTLLIAAMLRHASLLVIGKQANPS